MTCISQMQIANCQGLQGCLLTNLPQLNPNYLTLMHI